MSMLPCPFCGKQVDLTDEDTLYPSGDGWLWDEFLECKTYHSLRDVPQEQWCYLLHCSCGVTMYGDSKQETIENWNRRS